MDMISVKVTPSLEREKMIWLFGKNALKTLRRIAFVGVFCVVAIVFCVVSYVNHVGNLFNLIFGCLLLLKAVTDYLRIRHAPKTRFKKEQEYGAEKVYSFDDRFSEVIETGKGLKVRSKYAYRTYRQAIHTNGWFVIKFDKYTVAFNDNEFAEGSPEQLKQLLRDKLKGNFEEK